MTEKRGMTGAGESSSALYTGLSEFGFSVITPSAGTLKVSIHLRSRYSVPTPTFVQFPQNSRQFDPESRLGIVSLVAGKYYSMRLPLRHHPTPWLTNRQRAQPHSPAVGLR